MVIAVDVTKPFVTVTLSQCTRTANGPCVITVNRQWFVCLNMVLATDTAGFHKQLSKKQETMIHTVQDRLPCPQKRKLSLNIDSHPYYTHTQEEL